VLAEDINREGIASDSCMDYSWCSENDACNGSGTQHFNNNPDALARMIPKCGCYFKGDHKTYHIKDIKLIVQENDANSIVPNIKQHIFEIGPIVGGFHVLTNFLFGNFAATGGVFLEDYNYEQNEWYQLPNQAAWVGSHAVSVMGWGVSKGVSVRRPDGQSVQQDIPYWYCRNSWGEQWGDEGYFRLAMYPFNKLAQFERTVIIQPGNMQSGGFITFKTERIVEGDDFGLTDPPKPLSKDESFYKAEVHEPLFGGIVEDLTRVGETTDKYTIGVLLILIAVYCFIIFRLRA
jgi:hypothetical protein